MTVTEQLRSDITGAMKAGEKERVGALRLVLSELQKAEKEGGDDELTVLRRERKRRLDAAAQFRDGGRPELADQEESEAKLIAGYLPAELSDEELDADGRRCGRRDGRVEPEGHGPGDEGGHGRVGRSRRWQADLRAGARGSRGLVVVSRLVVVWGAARR